MAYDRPARFFRPKIQPKLANYSFASLPRSFGVTAAYSYCPAAGYRIVLQPVHRIRMGDELPLD